MGMFRSLWLVLTGAVGGAAVAVYLLREQQAEPLPATWPVGSFGDLRGVIDRRTYVFTRFTRTARGSHIAPEEDVPAERAASEEGAAWTKSTEETELLSAMEADVDMPSFLAGESTPVFAGSALTNFGVRHLLDAIVDLAPAPSPRLDVDDKPRHLDEPC